MRKSRRCFKTDLQFMNRSGRASGEERIRLVIAVVAAVGAVCQCRVCAGRRRARGEHMLLVRQGCGPSYLLPRGVEVSPRTRNWTYNALPKIPVASSALLLISAGSSGCRLSGGRIREHASSEPLARSGRSGDRGSAEGPPRTQGQLPTRGYPL